MKYAKAWIGAAVAVLTALVTGLDDGSLSVAEWLTAAIAGLVAGGGVAAVPNRDTAL